MFINNRMLQIIENRVFIDSRMLIISKIIILMPFLFTLHPSIVHMCCSSIHHSKLIRRRVLCLIYPFWLSNIFMFHNILKTTYLSNFDTWWFKIFLFPHSFNLFFIFPTLAGDGKNWFLLEPALSVSGLLTFFKLLLAPELLLYILLVPANKNLAILMLQQHCISGHLVSGTWWEICVVKSLWCKSK